MDKFIKPKCFETFYNSPNAEKEWKHWKKIFQNFLDLVEYTEDSDRLKILECNVSAEVYELINECTTFQEALTVLDQLYILKKSEVFARHQLAIRRQESGESITQYLNSLQTLSKDCNFTNVSSAQHRDLCIRDSFINGLQSSVIRQRLLENQTLELGDAVNQALSLESAQKQAEQYTIQSQPGYTTLTASVASSPPLVTSTPTQSGHNKTLRAPQYLPEEHNIFAASRATSRSSSSDLKCYYCGYKSHPRNRCPARDATCDRCKKIGHYSKVCKSNHISNSSITSSIIGSAVKARPPISLHKALVEVQLNKIPAVSLIDTGSSHSYVNLQFATKHKLKVHPEVGHVSMASTDLTSRLEGYVVADLKLSSFYYRKIKLSVLKELCADVLIGHDLLKEHENIEITFGGKLDPLRISNSIPASVTSPRLFSNLTPDCRPIATRSRPISQEDSKFVKSEISKLLSDGIIVESNSPWRAQVLVTKSETHKKRMVIDYSQTINKFTLLDAYPLPNIDDLVHKVSTFKIFSTIDLQAAYHQIPISIDERKFTAFEACGKLFEFTRIPFGVTNGVACFQRIIDTIINEEHLQGTFAYLDDITVCGETQSDHDRNLLKFMECAKKYGLVINESKSVFSKESISILGHQVSYRIIKPDPDRMKPMLDLPAPKDRASLKRVLGCFAYYSKWIPRFSDKIHSLTSCNTFPLPTNALNDFQRIKQDIANALITTISHDSPLIVETDASDFALAATLSQDNRPVAFFSRTLSKSEKFHSAVEKEAAAIMEALRKWRVFLLGRPFKLVTDQQALSFIFNKKQSSKIKNDKIMRWRLELSPYNFEIVYRPGSENVNADMLSRACGATSSANKLYHLHETMCHPGVTRMFHWLRTKNLPYSLEEVRKMTSDCPVCAEVKPRFMKHQGHLIKATAPMERLNIDFKGFVPSNSRNRYILTVVDEYSRFPFAFPCPDLNSSTVIKCLTEIFTIFGLPAFIHSDRGSSFLSHELTSFLHSNGIATSLSSPYNPRGNGQVERYNGIVWKTVTLALKSKQLPTTHWESVLGEALHAIRSLLCTSTNCTPHERFLSSYPRRTSNGSTLPSWLLNPGKILIKKNVRPSKYDDLVEEAELIEANPEYAFVRKEDGTETTVSLRHVAPRGNINLSEEGENEEKPQNQNIHDEQERADQDQETFEPSSSSQHPQTKERPKRVRRMPCRFQDYVLPKKFSGGE